MRNRLDDMQQQQDDQNDHNQSDTTTYVHLGSLMMMP
jgi:hypothetical protein